MLLKFKALNSTIKPKLFDVSSESQAYYKKQIMAKLEKFVLNIF